MAIEVNSGGSQRAPLMTGACRMTVVSVNPTLDELQNELGIQAQKEPTYLTIGATPNTPEGGVHKLRLEFHLKAVPGPGIPEGLTARISLFLSFEYVDGVFLNQFGNFGRDEARLIANADDKGVARNNGITREAYDGEIDLMMLMEALCNVRKGSVFTLDKRDELFGTGDISEIRGYLDAAAGNVVQVLLGVQENQNKPGEFYQTAYKKVLANWQTKLDQLHKEYVNQCERLESKGKVLKEYFGPITRGAVIPQDFALRFFTPGDELQGKPKPTGPVSAKRPLPAVPGANPAGGRVVGAVAGGAQPQPNLRPQPQHIASDDDNDLPF